MSSKTQSNCLSDPRSGLRAFFGGFRDNSTNSGREQPFGASCRSVAGSFRETRSDLERIVSDTGATGSHPASPARCRSDTKTAPSIGSSRRFAFFFRTEQETRGREGGRERPARRCPMLRLWMFQGPLYRYVSKQGYFKHCGFPVGVLLKPPQRGSSKTHPYLPHFPVGLWTFFGRLLWDESPNF